MKTNPLLLLILTAFLLGSCAAPSRPETPGTARPTPAPTLPPQAYPANNPTPIVGSGVGPYPGPATPQPTSSPVPSADGQVIITLANDGQTIQMRVGEQFLLQLGSEYTWEATSANLEILRPVQYVMAPPPGTQGLYTARQAGQVELTASGDPACRTSKPACMMPSRLFKLIVIVK